MHRSAKDVAEDHLILVLSLVERISKTSQGLVVKEENILVLWISEPWSGRDAFSHEMVGWQKVFRASAFASVVSVFVASAVTTVRSGMAVFLFFPCNCLVHSQKSLDVSGA